MKLISDLRALLIGLWLGAACFFSFAVAPSAFAVLGSRELAGSLVSRTLVIVNFSGIAVGLILILMTFIKRLELRFFWAWCERMLLVIMITGCAVGQFIIGWWLAAIRMQLGKPIDEIPLEDPLRIRFDQLHQYSIWLLVAAMVASLIVFFIISGKSFGKTKSDASGEFNFQNEFTN